MRLAACLTLAALLLVPALAVAQPTVSVDAPMLALARTGAFTPIYVDITTQSPLDGLITIDFGNSAANVVRPYSVGRSSSRRVTVPVEMPAWYGEITVTVTEGRRKTLLKKVLEGPPGGLGTDALHIVAIGEDPLGLTMLRSVTGEPIIGHPGCSQARSVRVETLLPRALPNVWFGWTSVDLVVWRRPNPSQLSPEQQAALRGWVVSGGTLVVGLSDTWGSWSGSALSVMSGAEVSSGEASAAPLQRLVRETGLTVSAELASVALPVVTLTPTTGTSLLGAGGRELVVENGFGAGRVLTLAFDPGAGELRGALDREAFWRAILGLPATGRAPVQGLGVHVPDPTDYCNEGGLEYSWQSTSFAQRRTEWRNSVHTALSSFARANPLPLGTVLLFGIIYLLLIGPVDYFVTRKLGKPMLTWLTFPAIAIGFSVLAAAVITLQKAGDTELRCVEILDVYPQDLRGESWCAMWSSRRQDVRIPVPRGHGVVRAGGGADDLYSGANEVQTDALVEPTRVGLGYRASQWAVSTWQSAWVDRTDGGIAAVRTDQGVLVSNRSGIDLESAWVVFDGMMRPLGPLPDGQTATVGPPSPLSWIAITGRTIEPAIELDSESFYDQQPVDWRTSWDLLESPFSEHVARRRLDPLGSSPLLVGVTSGEAPAAPESADAIIAAFTIVRAALPAAPFTESSR